MDEAWARGKWEEWYRGIYAREPVALGALQRLVAAIYHAREPDKLTKREIQILQLRADDMSNVEIGKQLHIQPDTVKQHMQRAQRVLGVRTPLGAVVAAHRMGLID